MIPGTFGFYGNWVKDERAGQFIVYLAILLAAAWLAAIIMAFSLETHNSCHVFIPDASSLYEERNRRMPFVDRK